MTPIPYFVSGDVTYSLVQDTKRVIGATPSVAMAMVRHSVTSKAEGLRNRLKQFMKN